MVNDKSLSITTDYFKDENAVDEKKTEAKSFFANFKLQFYTVGN